MRSAHTVEQVRAAEAALMATLPEGALMQRAAAGLAQAVVELREQRAARVEPIECDPCADAVAGNLRLAANLRWA
ncbi:MAG: hypothetical protein WBQ50_05220, partial [Nocardioides sp.]